MDRAITTLKTLELKPYLTNDHIPVDIFRVIFGFTERLLQSYPYQLSPQQLACYIAALEDYIGDSGCEIDQNEGHFKRKKIFVTEIREHNMLKRLSELLDSRMTALGHEA